MQLRCISSEKRMKRNAIYAVAEHKHNLATVKEV